MGFEMEKKGVFSFQRKKKDLSGATDVDQMQQRYLP